jgi:hypothetical protein
MGILVVKQCPLILTSMPMVVHKSGGGSGFAIMVGVPALTNSRSNYCRLAVGLAGKYNTRAF